MKILFLGTPAFAVPSLSILIMNGYTVSHVVTAPDKPAGRGLQLQESEIKTAALAHNCTVLQPSSLKDELFLNVIKQENFDLAVVVAFRMMPQVLWSMPRLGTINLHGSILPQYRGAAPINWAIINGEKHTGCSTFFLKHEIDTGNIIDSFKVDINDETTAGSLHDEFMYVVALANY
jgi:methionyl-tRNA formyltransferase